MTLIIIYFSHIKIYFYYRKSQVICMPNLSAAISKNNLIELLRSKGFQVVEADLRPNYWFPCQTLLAELVSSDESARAIQELQNVEIMGQKYSVISIFHLI